ncbi:MAG: alpha/beta fold hydrolase, partial [Actinomycetota bacterium]|nr:alpha/beta fold hydrolase [Actinomycetota bacterium]
MLEGGGRPTVDWHVLDNAAVLAEADVTPVGTVLCVHGNPTWSYLWRGLLERATAQALAGGPAWRVIAVDNLEMGFSERTGARRTLPDRVEVLGRLTNALWLTGPVVTLGHDWGGVISLGWAVGHPEQLAGVMLLNTAVHQPADSPLPSPLRVALAPGVLGAATVTTPAFLETTLALAHPPLAREVKKAYRAPYRGAAQRGGVGQFVADIPVYATDEAAPELYRIAQGIRSLKVPALMLWGPRDPVFGDRYLNDLIRRMPHADVHRFEGAGHLVAEDADIATPALAWLDEKVRRRTRPGSAESRAEDVRMEPE